MQPNNNVTSAGTPTVAPTVDTTAPKDDIVFRDKTRRGSGMMIGMIVLALLAAGGIGFGVWAYLSGNQKETELNNKIAEYENQLKELGQSGQGDGNIDVSSTSQDDSEKYIYVGEWGLKIKVPETLLFASYSYEQDSDTLRISGAAKNEEAGDTFPGFADIIDNSLGAVKRYSKDEEVPSASGPVVVFSDDNYSYGYFHPQAAFSTDENEQKWELESTKLVETMLTEKENYIEF